MCSRMLQALNVTWSVIRRINRLHALFVKRLSLERSIWIIIFVVTPAKRHSVVSIVLKRSLARSTWLTMSESILEKLHIVVIFVRSLSPGKSITLIITCGTLVKPLTNVRFAGKSTRGKNIWLTTWDHTLMTHPSGVRYVAKDSVGRSTSPTIFYGILVGFWFHNEFTLSLIFNFFQEKPPTDVTSVLRRSRGRNTF